jgi:hypothetical protein
LSVVACMCVDVCGCGPPHSRGARMPTIATPQPQPPTPPSPPVRTACTRHRRQARTLTRAVATTPHGTHPTTHIPPHRTPRPRSGASPIDGGRIPYRWAASAPSQPQTPADLPAHTPIMYTSSPAGEWRPMRRVLGRGGLVDGGKRHGRGQRAHPCDVATATTLSSCAHSARLQHCYCRARTLARAPAQRHMAHPPLHPSALHNTHGTPRPRSGALMGRIGAIASPDSSQPASRHPHHAH